jgi:hypothetical protein
MWQCFTVCPAGLGEVHSFQPVNLCAPFQTLSERFVPIVPRACPESYRRVQIVTDQRRFEGQRALWEHFHVLTILKTSNCHVCAIAQSPQIPFYELDRVQLPVVV